MAADDETRAALWRQHMRSRAQYQAQLRQQLAGSPAAAAALRARWQPVIDYMSELYAPEESADLAFDPLGLSDQVNV